MADAGSRQRWDHTSAILAMVANTARNPKKHPRPYMPWEFNPYGKRHRRTGGTQLTPRNIGLLKAFVPRQKRE